MARTFTALAWLLTLLILACIGLGFWSFFLPRDSELRNDVFIAHYILGLTTSISILFVHCLVFIYFLGTGRWVKEVTLAYKLDDAPNHKLTRDLKRRTFPPALFSMLIGIAAAAAGAGVQLQAWPWHVHFASALLTLAINLWAFRIEIRDVTRNAAVIEAVMADVNRVRAEQGLNSNEEALAEEEEMVPNPPPSPQGGRVVH